MLSVAEAQRIILSKVAPLSPERLPLLDAVGRVLAEALVADRPLPAWDNSAMDGYAVRAAEATLGATLPVVDEIPAGDPGDRPLPPGAAARIFTGAPMPPGADAVVIQEDTTREGDRVTIDEAPEVGANIRRKGSDMRPGDALLDAGQLIRPGDLSVLTSVGRTHASVHRPPVVAIASSGDELVEVDGGPVGPGQVVNSNTVTLAAAVQAIGATPRVLPIIPDDPDSTRAALKAAARADVLVTSGGVSVGDYDFIGQALVDLAGEDFAFWKVAVKPGKPLAFGRIGDCAAFGLPGNPISTLVTFELFVRPALLRMMGHRAVFRRPLKARTVGPLRAGRGRQEYKRGALERRDGELWVDATRTQSSGALSSAAGADALLVVAPDAAAREPGDAVHILLLDADGPTTRSEHPQPD